MLQSILASSFRSVRPMSRKEVWTFARRWRQRFDPPFDGPYERVRVRWLRQAHAERAFGDVGADAVLVAWGDVPSAGFVCEGCISLPAYGVWWSLVAGGLGHDFFVTAADYSWTLWLRDHVVAGEPGSFFATWEGATDEADDDR